MASEESFIDKLLQKDNVTAIRRLIIGGLLAAATPFGIEYLVATGVACVAINAGVILHERRIQEKKLLNFYRDEIAALQHKSPEALTVDDLLQAAKPLHEGGKGIATLQKELDDLDTNTHFRIGNSSISSSITTSILLTISLATHTFLTGGLSMVLGLGLIGLGHTIVAKTVKATSQAIFGSHELDDTVHQKLMRIAEEIKEKPVSPVEIFGLFVDSNPGLKQQIRQSFKADYEDLPVLQKKQVVNNFEPQLRVVALTEAVNEGSIKSSLIGLIASGDANEMTPGFGQYRALFASEAHKVSEKPFEVAPSDINLSEYRKRIMEERERAEINKSLH